MKINVEKLDVECLLVLVMVHCVFIYFFDLKFNSNYTS